MSMQPDKQKQERHKLIKMHSAPPWLPLTSTLLCFFPHPLFLSLLPSITPMQAVEARSSLMFWVAVCGCQRSRQPYFLNGGVTEVNKAGWPFTSLHLSLFLSRSEANQTLWQRAAAVCSGCCFSPADDTHYHLNAVNSWPCHIFVCTNRTELDKNNRGQEQVVKSVIFCLHELSVAIFTYFLHPERYKGTCSLAGKHLQLHTLSHVHSFPLCLLFPVFQPRASPAVRQRSTVTLTPQHARQQVSYHTMPYTNTHMPMCLLS